MTAKEAIEIIKNRVMWGTYTEGTIGDSLTLAVEALKQEVDIDAISRKDALDEIREYLIEYEGLDENGLHNEKWCAMREAEMVLKDLPPVNLCEDVISREEVIQTINYYWLPEDASESLLVDMINELPPVQPVRPKGHWIELIMHRGMENYKCSVCNRESYVPVCMEEPLYSFCPVCGAKMEDCND